MTEEELAIALESLPSINAVSVARSPSGLENGLTRRFQLKILVLRRFSAYIRSTQPSNQLFSPSIKVKTISRGRGLPRIFKIHSKATHFDEAILITMSKSIADRYFFIEISDPSIDALTAMLLFLSALYLWLQWLYFNIARIRRAVSSAIASSRYYERLVNSIHVHESFTNSLSIVREESYSHENGYYRRKSTSSFMDYFIFSEASRAAIAYNMVCSHRYPLLAKSTQPPIPYWTQ